MAASVMGAWIRTQVLALTSDLLFSGTHGTATYLHCRFPIHGVFSSQACLMQKMYLKLAIGTKEQSHAFRKDCTTPQTSAKGCWTQKVSFHSTPVTGCAYGASTLQDGRIPRYGILSLALYGVHMTLQSTMLQHTIMTECDESNSDLHGT